MGFVTLYGICRLRGLSLLRNFSTSFCPYFSIICIYQLHLLYFFPHSSYFVVQCCALCNVHCALCMLPTSHNISIFSMGFYHTRCGLRPKLWIGNWRHFFHSRLKLRFFLNGSSFRFNFTFTISRTLLHHSGMRPPQRRIP